MRISHWAIEIALSKCAFAPPCAEQIQQRKERTVQQVAGRGGCVASLPQAIELILGEQQMDQCAGNEAIRDTTVTMHSRITAPVERAACAAAFPDQVTLLTNLSVCAVDPLAASVGEKRAVPLADGDDAACGKMRSSTWRMMVEDYDR